MKSFEHMGRADGGAKVPEPLKGSDALQQREVHKNVQESIVVDWVKHNLNNLKQIVLERARILGLPPVHVQTVLDDAMHSPAMHDAAQSSDFLQFLEGEIPDRLIAEVQALHDADTARAEEEERAA